HGPPEATDEGPEARPTDTAAARRPAAALPAVPGSGGGQGRWAMTSVLTRKHEGRLKGVDRANREIQFIATTQEPDRDGEVVVTAGIDLSAYQQNPLLCLDHSTTQRIGHVDALVRTTVNGVPALVGRATVLPPGISAVADQAYGEIVNG